MLTIRIKEVGGEQARQHARELGPRILRGAERGLKRALQHAVGVSQRNYLQGPRPGTLDIVTRALRDRLTSKTGLEATRAFGALGTNVVSKSGFSYPKYHELGSAEYAGRPFLSPAIRDSLPIIIREVNKGIATEVNKESRNS